MEDKVVLITGASSGIGESTAKLFAKRGCKKIAIVARRENKLKEVADECKKLGANDVQILVKDVTNLETSESIIKETVAHFGSKKNIYTYKIFWLLIYCMWTYNLTLK